MIATFVERQIVASEKHLGESADWLRDLFAASRTGFFKFLLFMPLSGHRAAAPKELAHIARIAAAASEDCGPCLNINIRFALAEGIDRSVVRAAALGRIAELSDDGALVWHYATAVASVDAEASDLAAEVEQRFGRKVLVDFALAIATTRVFPTMKRALGYARSCSLTPLALVEDNPTVDKDRHAA